MRLLAGLDEPATGHIERFSSHVYVAQQHVISPQTTLAELLGYDAIFSARKRIDSGNYQPDDLELLDGHWDVAERLSPVRAGWPQRSAENASVASAGGVGRTGYRSY